MNLFCMLIRSGSRSFGILEKNIILGSANASPNMIFLKDPIYFRITPLSVYITNNISPSGDITRQGFRVTSWLIFWYVTLEAMISYLCLVFMQMYL